jgi:hypothetical protein
MNLKRSLRNFALSGVAALALVLPGKAGAQGLQMPELNNVRTRVETTESKDNHFQKYTLGISPSLNKYSEFFRSYTFDGEIKGKETLYSAFGINHPIKFGDLKNNVILFGNAGDKEGFGLESTHSLGKLELTPNMERNTTTGQTRVGSGLNFQIGEAKKKGASIGIGYDVVQGTGADKGQYFANALCDLSPENHFNLAVGKLEDKLKDTETYSLGWGIEHHKTGELGWMFRGKHDATPKTDSTTTAYEFIVAQNSTLNWSTPTWYVLRTKGNFFDLNSVESPFIVERSPLVERTKQGLAARVLGTHNTKSGVESGNIIGEIAYKLKWNEDTSIASTLTYTRGYSATSDSDKIGTSLYFIKRNLGPGCLIAEASIAKQISGARPLPQTEGYFSVQYTMQLGRGK